MHEEKYIIGRVPTVLVFKADDDQKAVVTSIVAKCCRKRSRKRLFFSGKAEFDSKTAKHITRDILPLVDNILQELNPDSKQKAFEISIVNLSIASVMDTGMEISGFSADAAVFTALFSAALDIPLAQDFVATGHIASTDGDIRAVKSLDSKIAAASQCPCIKRFIFPAFDSDGSREGFQGGQLEDEKAIVPYGRSFFKMIQVENICQLLKTVLDERNIVIASLEGNYFTTCQNFKDQGSCIEQALAFLTEGNEKRFWHNIEISALRADIEDLRELLQARVRYQIRKKEYPRNFGRKLLQIILSVSTAARRTQLAVELVPIDLYFKLCQFTGKDDLKEDSRYLRDVFEGRTGTIDNKQLLDDNLDIREGKISKADLQRIFSQISAEQVSKKISQPLDHARAVYIVDKITIDSTEQFFKMITSFYLHLISHTALAPAEVDSDQLEASALQLLQRAFANNGGENAARTEAFHGNAGGLRFIFDQITEQFKFEQKTGYINSILVRAVDQESIAERIEFTTALLKYIEPWLPAEYKNRPPSTLIDRYQEIIKCYVSSLDKLQQTFRRF